MSKGLYRISIVVYMDNKIIIAGSAYHISDIIYNPGSRRTPRYRILYYTPLIIIHPNACITELSNNTFVHFATPTVVFFLFASIKDNREKQHCQQYPQLSDIHFYIFTI